MSGTGQRMFRGFRFRDAESDAALAQQGADTMALVQGAVTGGYTDPSLAAQALLRGGVVGVDTESETAATSSKTVFLAVGGALLVGAFLMSRPRRRSRR